MDVVPPNIKPPDGIELKISLVDKKRIGCFSLNPIEKGTEFGPYQGRIVYDKDDDTVDPKFSWEVFDLKTFKYVHTVDATNTDNANWMRYVCCARYFEEQNIVSTQNGLQVYYIALKDIRAGEELLTWFQPKKKKKKRSSARNSIDSVGTSEKGDTKSSQLDSADATSQGQSEQKRRRKPKVIPDSYVGPLDWEEKQAPVTKVNDDVFEPLQPGQKRRRRKKLPSSEVSSRATSPSDNKEETEEAKDDSIMPNIIQIKEKDFEMEGKEKMTEKSKKSKSGKDTIKRRPSSSSLKKESGQAQSIAEINNLVQWEYPEEGTEFNFELKKQQVVIEKGKRLYKCDICLGLYKHMFSLKRHYLRNHINYKYLSKSDMTNCLINLAQVKQLMNTKFPDEINWTGNDDDTSKLENVEDKNFDSKETEQSEVGDECSGNADNDSQDEDTVGSSIPDNDTVTNSDEDRDKEVNDFTEKAGEGLECLEENDTESVKDSSQNDDIDTNNDTPSGDNIQGPEETEGSNTPDNDNVRGDPDRPEVGADKDDQSKSDDTDLIGKNSVVVEASPMPGLYRCYTCYLTFDDFESIREHTQNHPEQVDGACFACDLCSMRFNYKHNLVRHQKTHEYSDMNKKSSGDEKGKQKANETSLSKKHSNPVKNEPASEKKATVQPTVHQCGLCRMKFDTQPKVVKHVEEEHKSGSDFQCIYCGKDFQSMPNMKKHVRFHLGYKATCRICSEAFSNVGALRKHTRVSHPDVYKARLIERLEKYGVLKGPDKNALSKEVIEKINSKRKSQEDSKESSESVKSEKKEVKKDESVKEIPEKEEEIDHEINFTADEIDDGGSRFKFACTVCKKRFSSYINMCRHRRKVHSNENRNRTEQCLTFGRKPRNNPSPVLENPIDIAAFYANVSHNIATNLNCYIDGKPESLKTFVNHIKVEGYTGNFGYNKDNDTPVNLTWEKYNFPHNYKPAKTVSFADIKNVLNIHNDFDSHCVAVDKRIEECANSESEKLTETQASDTENTEISAKNNFEKCCIDTAEESDKFPKERLFDDSIEDLEVREINRVKSEDFVDLKDTTNNSELEESNTMGKSSHGLKVLASLGSVLTKKGSSNSNAEKDMQGHQGHQQKFKVIQKSESPAAKTFHQVKLGEYANFQDDLLSCDIDCSVVKATHRTSYSQNWKNSKSNQELEKIDQKQVLETSSLVKEAEDELVALYDSIDDCEPEPYIAVQSPKPLSTLCEELLGLDPSTSRNKLGTSLNNEVADQLQLTKGTIKSPFVDCGPDYSDATEESPFYNYETIAFGKNGQIEQVCAICKKHFPDFDTLLRHHTKKHPSTMCSFLEVENGHDIDDLHFSDPSSVGALAVTDPGLESVDELKVFKCTNCNAAFKTVAKLHVHIINCSSIDPLYGVHKSENSPTKTPLKRKLHRKILNMFGNRNEEKSESTVTHFKLSQQRNDTQSPKRVFTGCRKRTSVILPDSPQKLVCEQRQSIPNVSGYNPQNHIRRRELTEILDTLTCKACGMKFKTIIILERHIKYCTKKEKFKTIKPMACPLIDESLEKIKNMCLYCNKNFTYTKSLLNHFQDFCPIKKARLDKGDLTEQDKIREREIIERIQKADEEKSLKQKEMENRPKRNVTWKVGRKGKRKGHSWTNIKKKSQPKQTEDEGAQAEESEENEESGSSSESDDETEETAKREMCTDEKDEKMVTDEIKDNMNNRESEMLHDNLHGEEVGIKKIENESADNKQNCDEDGKLKDVPANLPVEKVVSNESSDKQLLNSCVALPNEATVAVLAVQTPLSPHESGASFAIQPALNSHEPLPSIPINPNENTSGTTKQECVNQLVILNKDVLKLDNDVMNTSLNCTARYSVNQVTAKSLVKVKYRPIAPKPKSSSVMLQCVSKQLPNSEQASICSKTELEKYNNSVTNNMSKSVDNLGFGLSQNTVSVFNVGVSAANEERSFQLAQKGLVTGKRKRARVGKVEEFLRNAFKRKRKKGNIEQDPNSTISHIENLVNQTNDNTAMEDYSKTSTDTLDQGYCNVVDKPSNDEETKVDSDFNIQSKAPVNTNSESPGTIVKRKRGRPRLSENKIKSPKSLNQNMINGVVRKRGRPRKFPLVGPTTNMQDNNSSSPENLMNQLSKGDGITDNNIDLNSEVSNTTTNDSAQLVSVSEEMNRCKPDITEEVKTTELRSNEKDADNKMNGSSPTCNSGTENEMGVDNNVKSGEIHDEYYGDESDTDTEFPTDLISINTEIVECKSYNDTEYKIEEKRKTLTKTMTQSDNVDNKSFPANVNSNKTEETIENGHMPLPQKQSGDDVKSFDEVDGHLPTTDENRNAEPIILESTETTKSTTVTEVPISSTEMVSDMCDSNDSKKIVSLPSDYNEESSTVLPAVSVHTEGNEEHEKVDTSKHTGVDEDSTKEGVNSLNEANTVDTHSEDNDSDNDTRQTLGGSKKFEDSGKLLDNRILEHAEDDLQKERTDVKSLECDINSLSDVVEPILSPSERVKMHRRSCSKKTVDLTSPVWVKRTKSVKSKDSRDVEVEKSENIRNEAVEIKNRKRKMAESENITAVSKFKKV